MASRRRPRANWWAMTATVAAVERLANAFGGASLGRCDTIIARARCVKRSRPKHVHIARGLTFWMRSSAPCNRLEEVCGRGRAGLVKRKRSAELVDTDGGAEASKSCGKQQCLGRPRCFVHNTTAHLEPRIPFKNYRHAVSERNMCIEMSIPCTIPSLPPAPCPRPPPSRFRDVSNGKQGDVWVCRGVYLDRPSAVIIFCRKRIRASRLRILNKSATTGNRRNTVR